MFLFQIFFEKLYIDRFVLFCYISGAAPRVKKEKVEEAGWCFLFGIL